MPNFLGGVFKSGAGSPVRRKRVLENRRRKRDCAFEFVALPPVLGSVKPVFEACLTLCAIGLLLVPVCRRLCKLSLEYDCVEAELLYIDPIPIPPLRTPCANALLMLGAPPVRRAAITAAIVGYLPTWFFVSAGNNTIFDFVLIHRMSLPKVARFGITLDLEKG
jgi:hypothetical protein